MATPAPPKQLRGAPLVAKVLDTVLAEIARAGLDHLSVEEVAARAGVNKTTIYRRWPSPQALALAAFERGSDGLDMPDTGSLRADLVAYLQRFRAVCRSPAMRALARMRFEPEAAGGELGSILRQRIAQGERKALVLFERALARGELPLGTDAGLLRDLVVAIAYHVVMVRDGVCSDDAIARLVDTVLFGAARSGPP